MAKRQVNATRERIKEVAQQLIAEHGVDGISIRDIITAAGQRNMASLYYYFRSKEALIRELITDASMMIEGTRADHLARLEEIGEPLSIRQVIHVIMSGAKLDPSKGGRNATVMRFVAAVSQSHRHLIIDTIASHHLEAYQHCIELLRRQLSHIPRAILDQRLQFLAINLTSMLVAREAALCTDTDERECWNRPGTYLNMLDFLCGALQAPVTQQDLAAQTDESEAVRHFSEQELVSELRDAAA